MESLVHAFLGIAACGSDGWRVRYGFRHTVLASHDARNTVIAWEKIRE